MDIGAFVRVWGVEVEKMLPSSTALSRYLLPVEQEAHMHAMYPRRTGEAPE